MWTASEVCERCRGGQAVLRSKTPELVEQEFYGLLLAHWTVRSLMQQAAEREKLDPDRLSFTHALRSFAARSLRFESRPDRHSRPKMQNEQRPYPQRSFSTFDSATHRRDNPLSDT